MPLKEKYLETESSVDFGVFSEDDQDDAFQIQNYRLPFSNLRSELKRVNPSHAQLHRDVLGSWNADAIPDDVDEVPTEQSGTEADRSLRDHELQVKGKNMIVFYQFFILFITATEIFTKYQ